MFNLIRFLLLLPVFLILWIVALASWIFTLVVFLFFLALSSIGNDNSGADWHGGTPLAHFEWYKDKLFKFVRSVIDHLIKFFG